MEQSVVGGLINFRGLVYSPINEQGVVFLFGRVLEDLNMYIEEVRTKYPDCVARRYTGKGWERVYIEFEYTSSNFEQHKHDPKECSIIVCWEHDWPDCPLEVIELKSLIKELPNKLIERPDVVTQKAEYDLGHHYQRKNVSKPTQLLYEKLDRGVRGIDKAVWQKFAKTAITYYSPERMFIYVRLRKGSLRVDFYTNRQQFDGVKNIRDHENWGEAKISNEGELQKALVAGRQSYEIMKQAIRDNINTGWYALTPKEKVGREVAEEDEEEVSSERS